MTVALAHDVRRPRAAPGAAPRQLARHHAGHVGPAGRRRWPSASGWCATTTAATARSPVPAGPYTLADLGRRRARPAGPPRRRSGAHFAGLSLGGMVGMWLAAHAPERVDRLALLCTRAHAATGADVARAGRARCARTAPAPPSPTRWSRAGSPRRSRDGSPDVVAAFTAHCWTASTRRATPPAARRSPRWTCATRAGPDHRADAGDRRRARPGHPGVGPRRRDRPGRAGVAARDCSTRPRTWPTWSSPAP